MALEGNLAAFGLSEILQLIAVQKKTGMLTVTNVDVTTVMFFRGGDIVSTRDRRRKARDSFRDYLTRYGVLERDELIRISQISAQSKLDFTEILTSEGFLSPQGLLMHWRKQVQEAMHDILTWEEGSYKFVASQDLVDGIKTPGSFNVEGMLMESMRRIDEFPQMLDMFPNEKLVFSRKDDSPAPEGMTETSQHILSLIAAPATLRELIARGKVPVFEVYEALKFLRDKGLAQMEEPETDVDEPIAPGTTPKAKRRAFKNIIPFVLSVAMFLGASYIGFGDLVKQISPQQLAQATILADEPLSRDHIEHQMRWLIEAYHAQHGRYPANLSELRESGLASEGFLGRARSHAFRYRLTASRTGYILL